ncbi:UbiA family prenyltransferase [Candidatus Margulisiibacteriota bacterium]
MKFIVTHLKAFKIKNWIKNLLILVPLFTAHKLFDPMYYPKAFIAILSLSFIATTGYLINDIFDLEADKSHPLKNKRPLVTGAFSKVQAYIWAFIFFIAALYLALEVSVLYLGLILLYFILSFIYSAFLKKKLLIDVLFLTGLHLFRLAVGFIIFNLDFSHWFLMFSMFFFLSLAFLKRALELSFLTEHGEKLVRRNYYFQDREFISLFGCISGFLSILVLALYIQSSRVQQLYTQPQILWGLLPIFLYWISRIWIMMFRHKKSADPVLWIFGDVSSYMVLLLSFILVALATLI